MSVFAALRPGIENPHTSLGWTIFLASLPTLLTLVGTAAVAIRQLRHDRMERAKDRALEVKKEVLLEAVRGISEMQSALTKCANFGIPANETSEFYGNAGIKVSSALAIADLQVVEAIRRFQNESSQAYFELIVLRRKADARRAESNMYDRDAWKELLMKSSRSRLSLSSISRRVIACIRKDMQVDSNEKQTQEFLRIACLSDEEVEKTIQTIESNIPQREPPTPPPDQPRAGA